MFQVPRIKKSFEILTEFFFFKFNIQNPKIPIFWFLVFPLFALSQNEFWYFGNGAGIDFSSGSPVAISNGKLYTEEGCASISDSKGNLLFYTNGLTVWDKNHSPMPNGFNLAGGISSTQSAVILPMPEFPYKYYIFTVAEKAGAAGLSYSVVDLLAGSDKKLFTKNQRILLTPDIVLASAHPDVVQKNIKILAPVSEKLTAVKHSNGRDLWVIVHQWNSDAFYVFPVTPKGVGEAMISKIGAVHKETGAGANRESIGCLEASPDGKKLCSAICYKTNNDLELFDFDNSTGKISNLQKISTKGFAYGISFSPDNSKLYVSFLKGNEGIVQYNLNENFMSAIIAYNNSDKGIFGALKIAPDNKIYIARTGQYLDAIHKPNEKGAQCGYEEEAVFLNGKYSVYGLPADVLLSVPIDNKKEEIIPVKTPEKKNDCLGKIPVIPLPSDTEVFCKSEIVLDAGNTVADYVWSTNETTHKIKVNKSGKYDVKVNKDGCTATASVKVIFYEKPTEWNYLPEFKPSNAMFNNSFQFSINDVKSFEIKIYSPKGKLVYQSDNLKKFWDGKDEKGKELPAGEYKWEVTYLPKCGNGKSETKAGKVKMAR